MEHLDNIQGPQDCQSACDHLDRCRYFVYDYDTKDCELLDSDQRNCDQIRGPPEPIYEECQDNHSTQATQSTSTTLANLTTSVTEKMTTSMTPKTTTTTITTPLTTTSMTTFLTTFTPTTTLPTTYTSRTSTTTSKPPSNFVIMAVGGFKNSNIRLSDVELVDPFETDSNCLDPGNLEDKREGLVAELFEERPFICGGNSGENLDSCYTFVERGWILSNRTLIRYAYISDSALEICLGNKIHFYHLNIMFYL